MMVRCFKKIVGVLICSVAMFCHAEQPEKPWYEGIFQEKLIDAFGREVSNSALKGKMVGVYFSASWCGPCRGFTPQLVKFYNQAARENNIEIIFVSSDRNADAMMQYMKKDSMPWLALPFNAPSGKELKRKLGIRGIPTLVIYNSDGKLITTQARRDVATKGIKAVEVWRSQGNSLPDSQKSSKKKTVPSDQDSGSSRTTSGNSSDISSWLPGPTTQWHIRMDTALNAAQKEHQKIFVLTTGSDWCGWCRKLYKDVLSTSDFINLAKDKMILVYMDTPMRKPMPELQKLYNKEVIKALRCNGGVPNVSIFNEKGMLLGKISGYRTTEKYMQELQKILEKESIDSKAVQPPEWIRKSPEELTSMLKLKQQEIARAAKATEEAKKELSVQIVAWGVDENAVNRPFDPQKEIRVPVNTRVYFKVKYQAPQQTKVFLWFSMPRGVGYKNGRAVQGDGEMLLGYTGRSPMTQKKMIAWLRLQMPESRYIKLADLPCIVTWE